MALKWYKSSVWYDIRFSYLFLCVLKEEKQKKKKNKRKKAGLFVNGQAVSVLIEHKFRVQAAFFIPNGGAWDVKMCIKGKKFNRVEVKVELSTSFICKSISRWLFL